MFDGIVQQIDHGLLHGAAVEHRLQFPNARLRRDQHQAHTAFGRRRFHQLDRGLEQRPQIRRLELVFLSVLLNPRKIQHVLDQRRQATRFLSQPPKMFALPRRFRHCAPVEILGKQSQTGHGRPQFVGDTRNEI